MADNSVIPSGDSIAADDIGGVKFQRIKLISGVDGTNDGDISKTNPYPVRLIPAGLAPSIVSFTRPSNSTAYSDFDVVCNAAVLSFASIIAISGGSGTINKAILATTQKTCTAQMRLWLFNVAPTAIADNAPFALLYVDIAKYEGYIDFPALSTQDPTNSTMAMALWIDKLDFVCASASTTLFGILTTQEGLIPDSGQGFTVELFA